MIFRIFRNNNNKFKNNKSNFLIFIKISKNLDKKDKKQLNKEDKKLEIR